MGNAWDKFIKTHHAMVITPFLGLPITRSAEELAIVAAWFRRVSCQNTKLARQVKE